MYILGPKKPNQTVITFIHLLGSLLPEPEGPNLFQGERGVEMCNCMQPLSEKQEKL